MKHKKLQTIMAETKKKLVPYTEKVEYLRSELATAKADYEQAEPKHGRKAISIKFEISEINKELDKAKYDLEAQITALSGSLYRQLEIAKQEILDAYVARVKGEKGEALKQAFSTLFGLQNEISLAARLYQDELNTELREFRPYGIGDSVSFDRLSSPVTLWSLEKMLSGQE